MSKQLIVNNKTFNYPQQGEDPTWGNDAADWASEVTTVLNDLVTPGDILQTTFTIANNQSSTANIEGLLLDTGNVRSAVIEYSIYRVSTSQPSGNAESGTIHAIYDTSAATGYKWTITVETTGDAGVSINVTDTGQFTYTSTDIGTLGYSGIMKFRSKSTSTTV